MFHLVKVKKHGVLYIDELNIPSNTITCIVGKSGSGKTTLLKMLNGMIDCDEGEINVDSEPISGRDLIELRRNVVMLQQNPAIDPGQLIDRIEILQKTVCSRRGSSRCTRDLSTF